MSCITLPQCHRKTPLHLHNWLAITAHCEAGNAGKAVHAIAVKKAFQETRMNRPSQPLAVRWWSPAFTGLSAFLYMAAAVWASFYLTYDPFFVSIGAISGAVLGTLQGTLKHDEFSVKSPLIQKMTYPEWAYFSYRLACAVAVGVAAAFLAQELLELNSPRGQYVPAVIGFAAAFVLDPLRLVGK